MTPPQHRAHRFIRFLERYTKTDMAYLARSGVWGNLSTMSVTVFSLVLYYVFARYVSREAFGVYQYLLSLGALLGVLTFTGINTAVTSAVARGHEGALRQAVRLQWKYAFVPIVAALAVSAYYALNSNAVLAIGVIVVGVLTPLLNGANTYSAFLVGKQDFKRVFLYNFWINVPFYALLICAALIVPNPLLLVGIALGAQALGCIVALRKTYAVYRPQALEDAGLPRYGLHLSAMGALGVLALQADTILAFHFVGAAGLAVYTFAVAIPERLGGLVKFIPMAALPRFSTRGFADARRGLLMRLPLAALLLALIAGAYALAAPYVFALLFPTYGDSVAYSQWYALAVGAVLTQLLVTLLSSHAFVRRLYAYHVTAPVLQLLLQFLGVAFYGLPGLIAGRLLGTGAAFVIALALVVTARQASAR
jgi:O-antigen/teichoic acid export membrane protein